MKHPVQKDPGKWPHYIIGTAVIVLAVILIALNVMFYMLERNERASLPQDRLSIVALRQEAERIKETSMAKGSVYDYPEHFEHHLSDVTVFFGGPTVGYIQAASCIEYPYNYSADEENSITHKLVQVGYLEVPTADLNRETTGSQRILFTKGKYEVSMIIGEPNEGHPISIPGAKSGSRICVSEHELLF